MKDVIFIYGRKNVVDFFIALELLYYFAEYDVMLTECLLI